MLAVLLYAQPSLAQKSQQQTPNIGASFLLVNPDARSSATGDAVTGLEPNGNDMFGNAAKLPFAGPWGVSASYSPWMYDLNDNQTNMAYVSAFKTFAEQQSIGLSVKYFNYGDITFRDENGMALQQYRPKEFAIDAAYARKLGRQFSLAVTLRYIRSELGSGTYNGQLLKPASAVAGDVGLYSQGYADHIDGGNRYCWGIAFTNIGSKLRYTDVNTQNSFLPMNLRLGGGYSFVRTPDHQFSVVADIQKLLVPTPPEYRLDDNGMPTDEILRGKDPNRGVPESIFSSFGDAPGGFREELREFTAGGGLEYTYRHVFFARTGYFYEHPDKGNRQHFTVGLGVNIKGLGIDMAYMMPTGRSLLQRRSFNFTLTYAPFREL